MRRKRKYHSCVLVGPVIRGQGVAPFNRQILHLRLEAQSIDSGTFGAVKAGGGRITQVKYLGRVTVPLEEHLSIVKRWLEDIMEGNTENSIEEIIDELQGRMMANRSPTMGVETMQLDVFSAVIVNRMEDGVFVYRKPSSFP